MDFALAQVRDLQKRLYSPKSEQANPSESRSSAATCRKRGQQRGTVGHGRTVESQLSERHEDIVLEKPQCPECGLALKEFAGIEDTQALEIEVSQPKPAALSRQNQAGKTWLSRWLREVLPASLGVRLKL